MVYRDKKPDVDDEDDEFQDLHPGLGFAINDINIKTEQQSGHFLLDMLKHSEINLDTPFQRSSDLWPTEVMSRFIESMMLRFPIPPFYFNVAFRENDSRKPHWEVIDGLQRLSALQRFFFGDPDGKKLVLKGLDFFPELNGKTAEELPRHLKRNIDSSQITLFLVYPNTPKQVKYRIFERVNTGGLKLNDQEIRHALNQGRAVEILASATKLGLRDNGVLLDAGRMKDQELALRCLAFRIFDAGEFPDSMKKFLDNAIEKLGAMSKNEATELISDFSDSVAFVKKVFGKIAFRRTETSPINRALFDSYTYSVSQLSDSAKSRILRRKNRANEIYKESLENENYIKSITSATARIENIKLRFSVARDVIGRIIND